jgi:hypothetical protein
MMGSLEQLFTRVKADRLLRWSAYAALPVVWLALALLNPFVLVVLPLIGFGLWRAMESGLIDRRDPPDDPDLY